MGQKLVTGACPCLEPGDATAQLPQTPKTIRDQEPAHYEDDICASTTVVADTNETTSSSSITPSATASEGDAAGVFQNFPDEETLNAFDRSLPVFSGMLLQQKFSNKASYDTRFVWIKLEARTICLSEFETTKRKHKEAKISSISGIIAGPPEKFKATNQEKEMLMKTQNWDCFLSVKFESGGGIDLRFEKKSDRDMWLNVLNQLLAQQ